MKNPFNSLRVQFVNVASHLNPRPFSSTAGPRSEETQARAILTNHALTPAYFFHLFSRRCHLPIYSLLHAIHLKRRHHPLSETLHLAGISQAEFVKWKLLLKEKNLLTAVDRLYQHGYLTNETAVYSRIGPDEDGVYYTPSGGKWSIRPPVPTWLLLYVVAYKVRAPHHAQGELLDLVFSHLDFMQPGTEHTCKGEKTTQLAEFDAFGGPRGPLLILTMLHLARFRRPLAMPHIVEHFLSLPELMQFRTQREAQWNEACFNALVQAALINTAGHGGGSNSGPSALSPSSATLSPQVARIILPVILTMSTRQLHLYRHSYNLILQPANVNLVVELAKHLRAKAIREGYVPTRKTLEMWAKLVFPSSEDNASTDGLLAVQGDSTGDPTSAFEFLRSLLRPGDQEAMRSNVDNAEVKSSVATLMQPRSFRLLGKTIPHYQMPSVIGVLSDKSAGGTPPPIPVAISRSGKGPTQIWTRAFTLAAKDIRAITSSMLVYFFERATGTVSLQITPSKELSALRRAAYVKVFNPDSAVVSQPIRLTVSHYTTLLQGLLLRRSYFHAEKYFFKLLSSGLPIDARALGVGLVILTRMAKPGIAIILLEKYASSGDAILPLPPEDRMIYEPVRMNIAQFNDFFVALIRRPTVYGSLALPPPVLPFLSRSLFRRTMHSARPDVVLVLFDAMGPLYGVWPDERSICLMLQAVRMVGKMNDTVRGGWRQWNNLRMAKGKANTTAITTSPGSARQVVVDQIYALLWEPSEDSRKWDIDTQLQPRAYSPGTLWAGELPFERARKIFHRLVWGHAQSANATASEDAKVDLRKVKPPARAIRDQLEPDTFSFFPKTMMSSGEPEKGNPFDGFVPESVPRWHADPKSAPMPRLEATTFHQYILLLGVSSVNLSNVIGSSHPGIAEVPLVLSWMRALGVVPMQETLAAALVLWAEATGRPPLFDDILSAGKLLTPDPERTLLRVPVYDGENSESSEEPRSRFRRPIIKLPKSEYSKLLEWMVDWVEEEKSRSSRAGEVYVDVEMPTPGLIWRWSDIIRLMREGHIVEGDGGTNSSTKKRGAVNDEPSDEATEDNGELEKGDHNTRDS